MAKYATRQEFMNSFNSPVLYVSFENEETIVAKKKREIKKRLTCSALSKK